MWNFFEKRLQKKEGKQQLTTNFFYNFLECFAKKHSSFAEPLSDPCGTLGFSGILETSH